MCASKNVVVFITCVIVNDIRSHVQKQTFYLVVFEPYCDDVDTCECIIACIPILKTISCTLITSFTIYVFCAYRQDP